MNEFKIRAWDGSIGSMVYSDRGQISFSDGSWQWHEYENNTPDDWPISSGKLMQYMGVKDKNGEDIYEKDIVRSNDKVFEVKQTDFFQQVGEPDVDGRVDVEVIGNTFKDPKLVDNYSNRI